MAKKFKAVNEDGQQVDGGNPENTAVVPTEKKRGRQPGQVSKNQNLAIVINGDNVTTTSFTKKTDLSKWCLENLAGGVDSLVNDTLFHVDGGIVLLMYGHVLKAQTKTTTRVVL